EGWCSMAGMVPAEAMGRGWTRALHPDDRERSTSNWYGELREPPPFMLEYRFLGPDGKTTWVHGSAVEFRDAAGMTGGFIGTLVDITEQKAGEFALRESEKRFRTMAGRAPVGIFLASPRGDTAFVNDAWCAMSGVSALQAQGEGWLQAVHP